MRRTLILAALAALLVGLAACGSSPPPAKSVSPATKAPCATGTMGCSLRSSKQESRALSQAPSGVLVPDASEFQGCPRWQKGIPGVVFRVYEAGTGLEDRSAMCNARRLREIKAWDAVYAFLRPGSCAGQADRTVSIVRSLGGVVGPIIADAEVPLPNGFVACFDARVARDTGNTAQVDYSSPGTWPGGVPKRRVWVATYGPRPGCVGGVCSHVAWQFSDAHNCDGWFGDCSLDSGIRGILQHKPNPQPDRKKLLAEREHMRRVLVSYGCRRRVHEHQRLGPRCEAMFAKGQRVNRELRR
jgi:hypothetical protein